MITNFQNTGWVTSKASLVVALTIIPWANGQTLPSPVSGGESSGASGVPQIVSTSPAIGAKDVSPDLKEITVTFDRDMRGGFSWTGGGPQFPPGREGEKPAWRNKRTCALPVKLEAGHYYRVGINSSSHQNFRSTAGVAANPTSFYFATKGAGGAQADLTKAPEIVKLEPSSGAKDVDPNLKELRVTFNMPMAEGFSWTGGGPQFPAGRTGERPHWSADHKTCILPVELKPDWEYRLGLNSPSHKNFHSAAGVPLEPAVYTFKTKPN